ncbi:MAG: tryptophan synthase subunit alpha [Mariprofundaceae bacterium]|nr:tryptophan synthase subunit alpha [Mariprofundaceae bacterium]
MSLSRLSDCFSRCEQENRSALVGYLCGGDPSPALSLAVILRLAESLDVIEIGMPFSDPAADGPVIQAASERALAAQTKMHDVFELCSQVRQAFPEKGIILMGYGNTVYAMGYDVFAQKAQAAGVDGVLVVDIPPEESTDFDRALAKHALHHILLLTPMSPPHRQKMIASRASGFIYYVSVAGITGGQAGAVEEVEQQLTSIRQFSDVPICVGFGIKTAEQAQAMAAFSDGVVMGSFFVSQIAEHIHDSETMIDSIHQSATEIRLAMRRTV